MPASKKDSPEQPWKVALATELIRELARGQFQLVLTQHAREQLFARNLVAGDAIYVMSNGHIYDEAEESTRKGFYKYRMESRSPNSESRTLRLVVVPSKSEKSLKVVTIMWVDESSASGGSR